MNYRFLILIIAFFLGAQTIEANNPQNVETNIDNIKIHLRGAEIIRNQKINLTAGKNELIITNLSPTLNASTIAVTASGEVTILSITSKINFLKEKKVSGRIATLQDSLQLLDFKKQDINDQIRILNSEQALINKNQQLIVSNGTLSSDDIIKLSNYYKERNTEIILTTTRYKRTLKKIQEQSQRVNLQLRELNANNKPISEIYVLLNSKTATNSEIKIRYIVDNAGWSPIYDLKAGELNQPINLKYRALAFNDTGVDWDDVKITLSTSDPYKSAGQPILTPWVLNNNISFKQSFAQSQGRLNMRNNVMQQEVLSDQIGDFTQSSSSGVAIRFEEIQIDELNKDFDINEKYTIPADRRPYSIDITNYDLKASYKHYAVPKMDKDAFLLAQITGWEELDLIEGPMNIYRGDNYIGLADLNTRTLNDTLELSLGRDKNVVISRIKLKDQSRKQFLGNSRIANYAYKVSVKNNHSTPINIELQDQTPISNHKEIEVTVKNISNATYIKNTGKLIWTFNSLPSGTKKSVEFAFDVKHPKNMQIKLQKTRTIVTPRYY